MSVFSQFLTENEIEIILVFFDKRSFQLSVQIVGDIDSYIDVNYVRESHRKEYPVRSRSGSRRRELSVAGWLYDSIERTREVARATANVTHNHPEGIKGAEAFYGIPAVLIAECKSRIDKGLMTDVLDEFDHVLGRSMDTYSDEMDEIQANQMIEAAIDQYYIQQDKNGMLLFMEVMVTRMQQAGEVVVPYITENPFMSEEQISKVKAGDTISLDHDVRLKIETVKDADEKEWIGVFTSSEEMHKGSAGNVQMNQSIESILRLALNWEQVTGIVINPFGKYIQMTKKMIELLINGYEHYENTRESKDDENN